MKSKEWCDTKTEWISGKHYCSFCGNEAKYECDYAEYTRYDYYLCKCKASKLYNKIRKLEQQLISLTNKEKINKLRYEEAQRQLKYKFGIKET